MHRSVRLLRPQVLVRPSFQTPIAARAIRPTASASVPALARSPILHLAQVRFYAVGNDSAGSKSAKDSAKDGKAPPTESIKHAAEEAMNTTTSAVNEIKGVAQSVASMISGKSGVPEPEQQALPKDSSRTHAMAGMEVSSHSHGGSASEDFASITRTMVTTVPKPILYFGLAGTLPYLGTSVGIIALAREAHKASLGQSTFTGLDLGSALENLHTLEHVQITYGAIILSFLGALHWGMEFAKLGGAQGYSRLALGTVPVLFAWPTTFLTHGVALAVQWAGFTGMWLLDQRASTNGWTTSWYSTYRFYLSIIVGFSIIATFVGTGYYGAGAGAATDLKKHRKHGYAIGDEPKSAMESLNQKKEKRKGPGKISGKVGGPVAVEENEGDESYGKIRNVEKEEEEKEEQKKKKAEEDKKNAEFQDKRDEHQMDKAPGSMKSDAKDRTGKNANVPGGEEEKAQGGSEGVGGKGEQGKREDSSSGSEKVKGTKAEVEGGDKAKKAGDEPTGKKDGDGKSQEKKDGDGKSQEKKDGDGKSQEKKDSPDKKDAANEKGNTGKR